jgi:hypothetical protein
MATCAQVVTSALRKTGAVNEGQTAPVAYDAQNALATLSSLYEETFSRGLFGRLTVVLADDDYEAGENERVINTSGGAITVTRPTTITEDVEEERAPLDLSIVVVTGAIPELYIYESNVADWVACHSLALADYAPLSSRGVHGLACWLAVRMAEESGFQIGPATIREAARFHGALAIKADGARTTTTAAYY